MMPPINAKAFARLCGISIGTVSGWCDSGMPCKRKARSGSEVSIDLHRALPWIVKQRALKPDAARVSVAREQFRRLRMANDLQAGETIDASEVRQVFLEAIAYLGQDLTALAQRITTDESIQAKAEDELKKARDRFADHLLALAGPDTLAAAASKKKQRR